MEEARGDAGLSRISDATNRFYDRIRHRSASAAAATPGTLPGFSALRGHKYCLLVTFKRSGEPVPTPVWFGLGDDGRLYARTESHVAKVKRICNDPHVRAAPCSMRGRPLGPTAEGTARILPPEDEPRAEAAISANYGLFRRLYEGAGQRLDIPLVYIEAVPSGQEVSQ